MQSVAAVTNAYTLGEKVAAVPIECSTVVDARTLARHTYSPTAHGRTAKTVNGYVDDVAPGTCTRGDIGLPCAYHLPPDYDPNHKYPMAVSLPGYERGRNGESTGVHMAAGIPATACPHPNPKGTNDDVIVLAPQNEQVGVRRVRGFHMQARCPEMPWCAIRQAVKRKLEERHPT